MDKLRSLFPSSFSSIKLPYTPLPSHSNGDNYPLLPGESNDEGDEALDTELHFEPQHRVWDHVTGRRPPWLIVLAILGVLSICATVVVAIRRGSTASGTDSESTFCAVCSWYSFEADSYPIDLLDPATAARISIDALYARQSSTLSQAMARYSLKTGRSPPKNYDRWFQFARDGSCLIDEYDQIHRDFEPFYQLAEDDPAFFKRMVDKATEKV